MRLTASNMTGIILLVVGIILLLANILNIKINIFRLVPGIILLIFGILVLFGQFSSHHGIIFDRNKIHIDQSGGERNIIFAEGILDLNDITEPEGKVPVKVNIIFGSGQLVLHSKSPCLVHASSVFSSLQLPDRTVNFMGSTEYQSASINKNSSFFDIEVNVIFGQFKIKE